MTALGVRRAKAAECNQLPFMAANGHGAAVAACQLLGGGLNRPRQHFILEGKDGVWDGTEIS